MVLIQSTDVKALLWHCTQVSLSMGDPVFAPGEAELYNIEEINTKPAISIAPVKITFFFIFISVFSVRVLFLI
jgi:competence transcription factor ComK